MRVLVTALAVAVAATAMTVASPAQATPTVLQRRAEGMLVADLGMHVVGVGYQHMASPWVSGQLVLAYYQPWTQNIDFLGLSGEANKGGDLRGGVVRARVFFHPAGGAPFGFWLSPFAQGGVGWGRRDDERIAGPLSAAGLSVGYSADLGKSWLLGGGFGLQVHAARIPGDDGPPSFSRFYPQVEIQLGHVLWSDETTPPK
ncbi:MAG: hypothetical protein JST00_18110 [Deltaproteobacteria bacterium]|nr:hypothetical protein [Deltaproteobacteria bacterium]